MLTDTPTIRVPARRRGILLAGLLAMAGQAGTAVAGENAPFVPGEVLAHLQPGANPDLLAASLGTVVLDRIASRNIVRFAVPTGVDEQQFASDLEGNPLVQDAELNYIADETDPTGGTQSIFILEREARFFSQASMTVVGTPVGQSIGLGWGITVAIIDSGVDTTHPFLRTRIAAGGLDLVDRGTAPLDDGDGLDNDGDTLIDEFVGHGTMVAGIVALVAPEARLLPIRVLDSDGSSTVFRLIDGIYAATDRGADILNISLGTPGQSELLMEAVLEATAAGRLVICSAGNDGTDGITVYPAGLGVNGVIGVAATRNNDTVAPFTNFGWVTMAAPGDPVVGPVPGGAYGRASGTSFSAPIVSGAAAILRSVMPAVPMDHIRSLIVETAQNVDATNPEYQGKLGSGRLSLPNAVKDIPTSRVADLNANRRVDVDDLHEMYQSPRDLNADGVIDQQDFEALEAFIRRGEHTLP